MSICGWDLATRKIGWCYGDGAQVPVADAILLARHDDDVGAMLYEWDRRLNTHADLHPADVWIFEAPILPQNRRPGTGGAIVGSTMTRRKMFAVASHLEFVARRRGILCAEESLQALKRELTGRAGAKKGDMVRMAEKLGVVLPKTDVGGREDAADAVAAWLIGVRHYAKSHSVAWDRRIWGARGALI